MMKNVGADGMNDALPDNTHGFDLKTHGYGGITCHCQGQNTDKYDFFHIFLRYIDIHDPLEKDGNHHGQGRGGEHQQDDPRHFLLIRRDISRQTFQLAYVKTVFKNFVHIISVACHSMYLLFNCHWRPFKPGEGWSGIPGHFFPSGHREFPHTGYGRFWHNSPPQQPVRHGFHVR